MIQIRRSVFETNSSSTHAFTFKPEYKDKPINEELFSKEYIIKYYHDKDQPDWSKSDIDGYIFIDVEEKLRYILTLFYASIDDYIWELDFLTRLQNIFPNAVFQLKCNEEHKYNYIFEDGEYVFHNSHKDIIDVFNTLSDAELKRFFQYGIIYYGDRNYPKYQDILEDIKSDELLLRVSG